jgi:hypothetical protein
MPSRLRFFVKDNNKTYTLKESVDGKPTQDAHYKFIKIKNAPKTK